MLTPRGRSWYLPSGARRGLLRRSVRDLALVCIGFVAGILLLNLSSTALNFTHRLFGLPPVQQGLMPLPPLPPLEIPESQRRELAVAYSKLHSVAFLHVGKAGGTSMDRAMVTVAQKQGFTYHGKLHYDWNYILKHFPQAHVLVLLRHPVKRAISQYYFSRELGWTKGLRKFQEGNINTFLDDRPTMMEVRNVWQDGEAAMAWFTGTHVAAWVKSNESYSPESVARKEERALWVRDMLLLAAGRLRRAFWIGILEDIDDGMERLSRQLGLTETIKFPHSNKRRPPRPPSPPAPSQVQGAREARSATPSNLGWKISEDGRLRRLARSPRGKVGRRLSSLDSHERQHMHRPSLVPRLPQRSKPPGNDLRYAKPTNETLRRLEDLMPMDMWIYRYAKNLVKYGEYAPMPPFPDVHCMSTRYILRCDAQSAYGQVFYHWPSGSQEIDARQLEILGPDVDFHKYAMPFRFYDDDYLERHPASALIGPWRGSLEV